MTSLDIRAVLWEHRLMLDAVRDPELDADATLFTVCVVSLAASRRDEGKRGRLKGGARRMEHLLDIAAGKAYR